MCGLYSSIYIPISIYRERYQMHVYKLLGLINTALDIQEVDYVSSEVTVAIQFVCVYFQINTEFTGKRSHVDLCPHTVYCGIE